MDDFIREASETVKHIEEAAVWNRIGSLYCHWTVETTKFMRTTPAGSLRTRIIWHIAHRTRTGSYSQVKCTKRLKCTVMKSALQWNLVCYFEKLAVLWLISTHSKKNLLVYKMLHTKRSKLNWKTWLKCYRPCRFSSERSITGLDVIVTSLYLVLACRYLFYIIVKEVCLTYQRVRSLWVHKRFCCVRVYTTLSDNLLWLWTSQFNGSMITWSHCFHSLNQIKTWELRTWSPFVLIVKRAAVVVAWQNPHVWKAVATMLKYRANCPVMLAWMLSLLGMACRILLTYVGNHHIVLFSWKIYLRL